LGTDFQLIGVAGTATTIGAILRGHTQYDAAQINQLFFSREELSGLIDQLYGLKTTEIESINPVFLKGRADIILAGCIILYEIMTTVKADKIRVSTGGIRHGALLEKLYG
jgi:exopolyphosphatase/guanosine-5'-triphosphate,3'-diphosphate pyrophosphatase